MQETSNQKVKNGPQLLCEDMSGIEEQDHQKKKSPKKKSSQQEQDKERDKEEPSSP